MFGEEWKSFVSQFDRSFLTFIAVMTVIENMAYIFGLI